MKNDTDLLPFNFEILDSVKPSINGKDTYQRLLIRRVPATGEKVVSICEICETWMAKNGKEKDLDECDRCELQIRFLEDDEAQDTLTVEVTGQAAR